MDAAMHGSRCLALTWIIDWRGPGQPARVSQPGPQSGAIRARDHHHITIGIAESDLHVPRPRIDVRFLDDRGPRSASPPHDGIEVIDLEPKQHAVAGRSGAGVDEIGGVLLVPGL